MPKIKPPIPDKQLVSRLRLMAEAGGMLTKDRLEAVRQAADRIEEYSKLLFCDDGDTAIAFGHDCVAETGGEVV